MTEAQIAYWEQSLKRFVESDEWKKELETNFWRSEYMRSAEARQYIEQDNAQVRAFLTELGLAK
jgi:putative tricarboxylic transport membrane protein